MSHWHSLIVWRCDQTDFLDKFCFTQLFPARLLSFEPKKFRLPKNALKKSSKKTSISNSIGNNKFYPKNIYRYPFIIARTSDNGQFTLGFKMWEIKKTKNCWSTSWMKLTSYESHESIISRVILERFLWIESPKHEALKRKESQRRRRSRQSHGNFCRSLIWSLFKNIPFSSSKL